jgi:hypothetical protein
MRDRANRRLDFRRPSSEVYTGRPC